MEFVFSLSRKIRVSSKKSLRLFWDRFFSLRCAMFMAAWKFLHMFEVHPPHRRSIKFILTIVRGNVSAQLLLSCVRTILLPCLVNFFTDVPVNDGSGEASLTSNSRDGKVWRLHGKHNAFEIAFFSKKKRLLRHETYSCKHSNNDGKIN